MELLFDILGYGFITTVAMGVVYLFVRLLTTSLDSLTQHDD